MIAGMKKREPAKEELQQDSDADSGDWIWSFGACRFDERTLELTVGNQKVVVEARPLKLLRYLLRNANQDIAREQFLTDVWEANTEDKSKTHDFSVLSRAMTKLR